MEPDQEVSGHSQDPVGHEEGPVRERQHGGSEQVSGDHHVDGVPHQQHGECQGQQDPRRAGPAGTQAGPSCRGDHGQRLDREEDHVGGQA